MLKTDFVPEPHKEPPKCPKHNTDMTWFVFLKGRSGWCVINGLQEATARVRDQYQGYYNYSGRAGGTWMWQRSQRHRGHSRRLKSQGFFMFHGAVLPTLAGRRPPRSSCRRSQDQPGASPPPSGSCHSDEPLCNCWHPGVSQSSGHAPAQSISHLQCQSLSQSDHPFPMPTQG